MLEMFIKYPHLLTGVERDEYVDAVERLNVSCMEFKKMVSMVLIMPVIVISKDQFTKPRYGFKQTIQILI